MKAWGVEHGGASSNSPDSSGFVRVALGWREVRSVGTHGTLGRKVWSVAMRGAMGRVGVERWEAWTMGGELKFSRFL